MTHGLVELFSFGKDLCIGLFKVVRLEDVGWVLFHHAASEYLIRDQ